MNNPTRWIFAAVLGAAAFAAAALGAGATTPPNLAKALDEQARLVEADPYDVASLNDFGNLLQLAGRPEEAEAIYRRAIELAPERVSARYNLALLLHRTGRRGAAFEEYRAVVERDPSHAWARYQIGAIHEAQGEDRRAVRMYGEAFALEPRLAFPEYNPGVIENHLVEEAMLTGYRAEAARPLAPQVYEQPGRIRSLMLPPAVATTAEAETAAEEPAETAEAPPVGPAETLSPADLDARSVNQAAPQGVGRSRSRSRYQPPSGQTRVRTFQRPQSQQDDDQGRGDLAPGTVIVPGAGQPAPSPGPRVITPEGRVRHRPGALSTGRLDLELVPPSTERPS